MPSNSSVQPPKIESRFRHKDKRGGRNQHLPNVNIRKLAKRAKVSREHLGRVISGKSNAGKELLFSLGKVLEMTVEDVDRWLKGLRGSRR